MFDVVKTKASAPGTTFAGGSVGTVVIAFPEAPGSYDVEFADDREKTSGLVVLSGDDVEAG